MLLWKPRLHRLTSAVQQRELVVVIVHRILYFTSVALSAHPTLLATSTYVYAWALYHWKRIFHAKRTSHHKDLMTMYILPLPPPPEGTLIVILIRYNVNRSCQQREANNMFCVGFPRAAGTVAHWKMNHRSSLGFKGSWTSPKVRILPPVFLFFPFQSRSSPNPRFPIMIVSLFLSFRNRLFSDRQFVRLVLWILQALAGLATLLRCLCRISLEYEKDWTTKEGKKMGRF